MLNGWFLWFILFWVVVLISLMAIGGFFMFRKFLKALPKDDGKSVLDWEEYYVNNTIHLWNEDQKIVLNVFVRPVHHIFPPFPKQMSAAKFGIWQF